MRRLFGCTVSLIYEDARGEATLNAPIARLTEFWWSERQPDARSLWESKIELGEDFFNEIIRCPIPIDLNTLARDEAVAARPRPLPVAHLPAIRVEVPDTAHVKTALPTASTSPGARRGRSRSACVVNGRLRHTGHGALRRAPRCVVSSVVFSVSQTSSTWVDCHVPNAQRWLTRVLLITFHERPEDGVHAGLVSLPIRFQPGEHVGVQADIDAFFRLRHLELGAPPEVGISFRDVRIVEGLVRYRLNGLEPISQETHSTPAFP